MGTLQNLAADALADGQGFGTECAVGKGLCGLRVRNANTHTKAFTICHANTGNQRHEWKRSGCQPLTRRKSISNGLGTADFIGTSFHDDFALNQGDA